MGVIRKIFEGNWKESAIKNKNEIRLSVRKEVDRMLECGKIWNRCTVYRCCEFGVELLVPFTCKSRFCPSCGKLYRDKWAEKLESRILAPLHKHIVFTIPVYMEKFLNTEKTLNEGS